MARCEPRRRRTAHQTAPQKCGMDGKHGGAARAPTHVLLCAGVPVPISVKARLSTGTVSQAPAQATEPSKSAPRSAMQQAGRGAPTAHYGIWSVAATQQRSTARRTGVKANDSRHLARWRSWPRCDTAGTEPPTVSSCLGIARVSSHGARRAIGSVPRAHRGERRAQCCTGNVRAVCALRIRVV
jgi:hypothetical protein